LGVASNEVLAMMGLLGGFGMGGIGPDGLGRTLPWPGIQAKMSAG
jgi:hypothetical protein